RRGKDLCSIRIGGGEPLASRSKCANDFGTSINDPKLAVPSASPVGILADASVVNIRRDNAARQARLELRDAADLPSTEGLAGEARLLTVERQLVKVVDDYDMGGTALTRPPPHTPVLRIR